MLCKCHWIVLYTVHVTAFSLGGGRFFPDMVYNAVIIVDYQINVIIRSRQVLPCAVFDGF